MFISKFWILLLALISGLMLAVILLAKDVVNRERRENATAILYKEVTKADVALKMHARKRLDILLKVTVDPEVRRSLAVASLGADKAESVRDKLLDAVRKRNKDLEEYKADLLIALDTNGTVVCQVGKNERESGYSLAGFPAVDSALRGYVRDDMWKLGNEVFLIATRPVIHEGRYVGAMVHAMKITDKLASELSPTMQFALFAGNIMMAVGASTEKGVAKAQGPHIAGPLSKILNSQEFKKRGYSDVQTITTQENEFLAVYSQIRGEAAKNDVGFALVVPVTLMTAWTEIYEKAGTQDIDALPKVWLGIGFLILTIIGWALTYLEGQRPVSRLLQDVQSLEKSDPKDQLNVYRFRRNVRKLATAINALVDYKLRSMLETKGTSPKSIDSILGDRDSVRLSSASFKFVEPSASEVPPPPPPVDAPADAAAKSGPESVPEPPPPTPASNEEKQPEAESQPAEEKAPPEAEAEPEPEAESAPQPDASADAPKADGAAEDDEETAHFREIYEAFVALKKELGESADQLTFERFQGTLRKNRDTLKARYGCEKVKFQVYEKDGKASLKATPVKP